MPIYEYVCGHCQKLTEVLQKISDPHPTVCSHCQKAGAMTKRISQTSFVLKGGGWYADAYGNKKSAKDSAAPATPAIDGGEKKSADAPAAVDKPATPAPEKTETSAKPVKKDDGK